MSPEAQAYVTPVAFTCLSMQQEMDGAGVVYAVFQGEKDPNHTKYARIMRRDGFQPNEYWIDIAQVSQIYAEPKIMINTKGMGIVYGLSHDRKLVVRAEIPGWIARKQPS